MGGGVRAIAVAALLGLAGCAAETQVGGTEGPPSPGAAEACQAAVAAHVGKGVDAVAVDWVQTRADGVEVYEAVDGTRRHTCAVDGDGRVLRIDHPAE